MQAGQDGDVALARDVAQVSSTLVAVSGLGPSTATTSPGATSKETSARAGTA